MLNRLVKYSVPLVILLAFVVWYFIFRRFLFHQLYLTDDAIAYFSHVRFYLHNLERGIYPLWDPVWFGGVPVDFFLRRIGNFNPFYFLVIIFHKAGAPFKIAYLQFLAIYYFIGMIGFYHLARLVIKNKLAAVFSFLLLCFSSLGCLLFFSFIHLIYVPLFWFFYFLLRFIRLPDKTSLLGVTFTLMIMVTTYIPFYFLIILITVVLFAVPIFFIELRPCFLKIFSFLAVQKRLICICVLALFVSCIPQLSLYKSSADGQLVLPSRHEESSEKSIFTVGAKKVARGDMISQLYFDRVFRDHDKMELGVVYIPTIAFFIFLLSLFTKIDKKTIFLTLSGFFLFLIAITELSPVHEFLYKHFFVLKFIRQSYFFFWIGILPIGVLLLGVQLEKLLNVNYTHKVKNNLALGAVTFIYFGCIFYLINLKQASFITYASLTLAFGLVLYFLIILRQKKNSKIKDNADVLLIMIFFLIVLEPLNVFRYLYQNESRTPPEYQLSSDEPMQAELTYEQYENQRKFLKENDQEKIKTESDNLYYASKGFNFLTKQISDQTLYSYLRYRFLIYDTVTLASRDNLPKSFIENVLNFRSEQAVVFDEAAIKLKQPSEIEPPKRITGATEIFKLVKFTVNRLEIETNFDKPQFLVHNDAFHKRWFAYIDGEHQPIYQTNFAFKGIWVPKGRHHVVFQYESSIRYAFDFMIMLVFVGMFCGLVYYSVREKVPQA